MSQEKNKRILFILGSCCYFILFLFAIIFYKERILFIDMAFHSFYIINDENFAIQNGRYGATLSQILPLLAVKLHLPLKMILVVYSCSFPILYYLLFCIVLKKLNQLKFAALILLTSTLMTTDTFYWIQSELQQGLPFFVFVMSYISYFIKKPSLHLLEKILLFLSVLSLHFFHPLLYVAIVFCIIYFSILNASILQNIVFRYSVGIFIVSFFLKFLISPTSSYDIEALGKIKNFSSLFPHYFSLQSQKDFIKWCFFDYNMLVLFYCISAYLLLKRKKYKAFLFQFFSILFYVFFVTICYKESAPQFYMENLFLPLVILVCVPLLFKQISILKHPKIILFLVLVFTIRLFFIGWNHQKFSKRLEWHASFLQKTSNTVYKKIIAPEQAFANKDLIMTWGLGYELFLFQAINHKLINTSLLTVPNPKDYECAINNNKVFIGNWSNYKYESLNKNYFILRDTSNYVIIQTLDSIK